MINGPGPDIFIRSLDPAVEKRIRGLATTLLDYIQGAICPRIALEQMVRDGAGK